MSKTREERDKRTRRDLDLFVLALVREGLATSYALRAEAGLSPGATLQVFSRLHSAGFLAKGAEGDRGRIEYELTAKGKAFLHESWRRELNAPPPMEIDAVLRTAALGLLMHASEQVVADYLKKAGEQRLLRRNRSTLPRSKTSAKPLDTFLWMQTLGQASRLEQEAKLLRKLSTTIKRLKRTTGH